MFYYSSYTVQLSHTVFKRIHFQILRFRGGKFGRAPPLLYPRSSFKSWLQHRNSQEDIEKCPEDLLEQMDSKQLNHWLSVFLVETRKVDGEPYPPTTLHGILSGILRYMRSVDAQQGFTQRGGKWDFPPPKNLRKIYYYREISTDCQ